MFHALHDPATIFSTIAIGMFALCAIIRAEAQQTLPAGLIGSAQLPSDAAANQRIYTTREAAALRKKSKVYVISNIGAGNPFNQPLRHVGYLSELTLKFTASLVVTGAAGTVQNAEDQENYVPLLQLSTPNNNTPDSFAWRDLIAWNYRIGFGVNPRTDPGYANWTPATAGTYPVQMTLRFPKALGFGRNFATGLIARNTQQEWQLSGRFAAAGDLVGTGTAVLAINTPQLEIGEIWFDAMTLPNVVPPDFNIGTRHRQFIKQPLGVGDNKFTYPTPGPTLLDALVGVRSNGAPDTVDVALLEFIADGEYPFLSMTGADRRIYDYRHLGQQLPTGWFHADFFDDIDTVNSTLGRDQIDATLYSSLEWNVNMSATAGTTQSEMFYRELVDLETPAGATTAAGQMR